MRALVVTNMYPSPEHPALGSFVRDQVEALRALPDVDLELFAFEPGTVAAYTRAAAELRRRDRVDVVHAHFGLTAWPALAAPGRRRVVTLHGTDLVHPRSRAITLAALRCYDRVATVSDPLRREVPAWAVRGEVAVLPCGVDLHRFHRIERADARCALGLDPTGPQLLFPADPTRREKRYDQAKALAGDLPLHPLRNVDPAEVPLWVNAANAVIVPSQRESFGLAVLEALACDVPVLSTPVGIAPEVLDGVEGTLCAPFELERWRTALAPHLTTPDPRLTGGRARAEPYGAEAMARRVLAAWRGLG